MAKMKLTTKFTWSILMLTTIMIVVTTLAIAFGVYRLAESRVRYGLIQDVNNVITNNLTIVDGQIRQKDQVDGQTLGVVLRSKELSALIVDTKGLILARYGIYRDLPDNMLKIEPITKGHYIDQNIGNYGLFDMYTAPIRNGNDIYGYIRMTRKNTEISLLQNAILAVVLVLLPLSWILSVLFSYVIAKKVVNPIIKRERQMTENISHEFKTPLTRIASNLQVGKIKEAEHEVLELGGNVDALLSLAVWEKTDEKCDLTPIINHLTKLIPDNITVTISMPRKMIVPPAPVTCDDHLEKYLG